MTLRLTVDGDRWRAHLRSVAEQTPGLVPVAKGNGYGFGIAGLARRADWLGSDVVAVGTYAELPQVAGRYHGDMVVLTPWRPYEPDLEPALAKRVIHTVSREEDVAGLLDREPGARFLLERATSMLRHGMTARALWAAAREVAARPGAKVEGVALHLPLAHGAHLSEVRRLVNDVVAAELPLDTIWVSHLSAGELGELRSAYPDLTFRPRVGTDLWLGDRGALHVTATVLDVHEVERGDSYGYRHRTAPKAGHILVVSGGTAHGIGLEAPTGEASIKARAATLARGGLDAAGFVRSPFSIDGKQRLFAEPPHMQASMLFLPHGARVPAVGDQIDVRVRYTATAFDRIVLA